MEQSRTRYEPDCPLAHDFVNRLAALIGRCDLIKEELSGDSPLLEHLLAVRNIASGMAKELNQFQCDLVNLRILSAKNSSV